MRMILDRLGISSKYKGYRMLLTGIEIAVQDEDAVTQITQKIYPQIAQRCGTTPVNVEKNLRKVIEIFWNYGDRSFYDEIAGYSPPSRPTNAEFIGAISSYIIRSTRP